MKQTVMVTLDSMLDTRLGAIACVNQEWAFKMLTNGWHKRISNDYSLLLPEIDVQACHDRWNNRDVEVLAQSTRTNIFIVIEKLVTIIKTQLHINPRIDGVSVYVNIYPYVLSSEERNAIAQYVAGLIPLDVPIEIGSIPPLQLTGSYLKDNIAALIMDDANIWFDAHRNGIEKLRCPSTKLFSPRLYMQDNTPADPKEHDLMFDYKSFLLTAQICLEWLPVEAYSVDLSIVEG